MKSNKTYFIRKATTLAEMKDTLRHASSLGYELRPYTIAREIELDSAAWARFTKNLCDTQDWLADFSRDAREQGLYKRDAVPCILVRKAGSDEAIIVDTQGYDYARYTTLPQKA